eukprot:CAMPEP_0113469268 /NCGR_PEP_ID=MMETSP0014_2-20120614/15806_1 /TAXON_ID=2857 /ORGANISM="Nitzschia sp." /LENGTH=1063 /DNA_ID=CAMNT_0000361729 /DNA_START=91 /DNA_END=3282 /DNA_ORIENTATION=+ /assembly_acc=CAM_ASM_000159
MVVDGENLEQQQQQIDDNNDIETGDGGGSSRKSSSTSKGGTSSTISLRSNHSSGGGGAATAAAAEDHHVKDDLDISSSHKRTLALTSGRRDGTRLVYFVLITTAIVLSISTYVFLERANEREFVSEFYSYARETADLAETNAKNSFQQLRTLGTAITSAATDSYYVENESGWPNVTVPHWKERVKEISQFAKLDLVAFVPFVEVHNVDTWEEYANQNLMKQQYFPDHDHHTEHPMSPHHDDHHTPKVVDGARRIFPCKHVTNETRMGFVDEGDFMERILSEKGFVSYNLKAPIYQYAPASSEQNLLMMDMMSHPVFKKEIVASLEYNVPVISEYLDLDWMNDSGLGQQPFNDAFSIEQEIIAPEENLKSLMLDPVKESLDEDARTVGFVVGIVPWHTFLYNVLRNSDGSAHLDGVNGIVVKVVSDCGSTMTYKINSNKLDRARRGDCPSLYQSKYSHLNYTSRFFWKDHHRGESRHCHFDLNIYPSDDFYATYASNSPTLYASIVAGIFLFTALLFACYDCLVSKKQQKIVAKATQLVVDNAKQAARNERELNDFVAHEVRNPLAAAMSACSFVSSVIQEDVQERDTESSALISSERRRESVQEDIEIIESSLHFINDLLRNMLDMQRAGSNQMKIDTKPTNLMVDVLQPVQNMLHVRGSPFDVLISCSLDDQMVVMTDPLRLKQIMLNLTRNSAKFVEKGFICCKAQVNQSTGFVELCVEDSGPGISPEKRRELFGKFQDSLDSLHQGTGIGLSLCKKLTELMGGKLYIDEEYNSGIEGCPGARFVVQLNVAPHSLDYHMLEFANEVPKPKSSPMCTTVPTPSSSSSSLARDYSLPRPPSPDDFFPGPPSPTDSKRASSSSGLTAKTTCFQSSLSSFSISMDGAITATNNQNDDSSRPPTLQGLSITLEQGEKLDKVEEPPEQELPENLSVLFVDDDMVLRKLFSRTLKKLNPTWKVSEASNGETAIEMLTKQEDGEKKGFDLIFMDQYMASVNKQLLGTETVRAIRANGIIEPIICGLSANDVEDAFIDAGSDAFMFKPFPCKPDALKAELLRILNIRQRN